MKKYEKITFRDFYKYKYVDIWSDRRILQSCRKTRYKINHRSTPGRSRIMHQR